MKNRFQFYQRLEDKIHFHQGFSLKFILLCFCLFLSTINYAQKQKLSVSMQGVPLTQVIRFIEDQTNYNVIYSQNAIKDFSNVNVNLSNGSVEGLLSQALQGTDLTYEFSGNRILLKKTGKSSTKIEMFGRILSESGDPLPGVAVFEKGTQNGVSSDFDGNYKLRIKNSKNKVVFSFIGMRTREVLPKQGKNDIILSEDKMMLDDVVITGYQTISKERATGSFAVIDTQKMNEKLEPSILSRLIGEVPGLVNTDQGLQIRGIATLKGVKVPLFVVDGVPFEGDIESINPINVENVTILKDAVATSIYGARAANGVIVITTKKGSTDGKTQVVYSSNFKFTPKPDVSYLNLMDSKEYVDFQKYIFKFDSDTYEDIDPRYALNPVKELLLKHRSKLITDEQLENGLDTYRNRDNRKQLENFYLRIGMLQQSNLSISGGNKKSRYFATVNYLENNPNNKYTNSKTLGFSLRNNINFYDWLSTDLILSGSFDKNQGDVGIENYESVYTGTPSYYLLKDKNGKPLNIPGERSEKELERLRSIGLNDETYSPILNKGKERYLDRKNYYRIHLGFNFKITDYLNLETKYQTELSYSKNKVLYDKQSFSVRKMVNEAAQYDLETKELTLNVPSGGQLDEATGDSFSYTLRGQLNFLKDWDKHFVTAIAGAERRLVKANETRAYYMGYDDNSLGYKPINPLILSPLEGTESLRGGFNWVYTDHNYLASVEDRFVSFYANTSYTYNQKYSLTGSIRIDQSNLFGTSAENQYRPLWSVGGNWFLANENVLQAINWLNQFNLRVTYGVGGNIPKDAGPFLTLDAPEYNQFANDFGSGIRNPPNPKLTWEKTETTNLGLDFTVFNRKLKGSIDYYYKYTSNLLANRDTDPTLGWNQLLLNYGTMSNKGIELSLGSDFNIREFRIEPSFNFSYNENKLINVDDSNVNAFDYTKGNAAVKGYPYGSIFSFPYAGLSEEDGTPLYYNKEGEKVEQIGSVDDLVFSGTRIPKYSASLSNVVFYKNFILSFMFTYNGGHVMRGATTTYSGLGPGTNDIKEYLNVWKKPGDEKKSETVPALTGGYVPIVKKHQWAAANKHVVKADYMKLRNISLSYQFNKSWMQKLHADAFKLSLQLENILIWTANDKGFNPEAMGTRGYGWGARAIPQPTTYTVGLLLNF